ADPKVLTALQVELARVALEQHKAELDAAAADRKETLAAANVSTEGARKTLLAMLEKPWSWVSWTPAILSYIVVGGFMALVALLMAGVLRVPNASTSPDQVTTLQIINICIGAIATAFATVINFWLGSSLGSRNKDDALVRSDAVD